MKTNENNRKEYAIGEEFKHEGTRLRCDNGTLCSNCALWEINCMDIECTSDCREDNTEVIFEKVERAKKAKK